MAEKKISIVDYVEEERARKANPYDALIEALEKAGEGKAAKFDVPADEVNAAKRQIREAANHAGHTAKIKDADNDKNGKLFTVRLVPQIFKPRKGEEDDAAE